MPKIDIIVPVYNIEEYVAKCVDSLISQTFKDIRIILVDDGSTDGSGKLCDKYANEFDNIIVIHKENGGLSSARNAALEICDSDYIGFVDGDDYVDRRMFERLYSCAENYSADISCCMMYDVLNEKKSARHCKEKGLLNNKIDIIKFVLNNGAHVCNKLFKREIFDNLRFLDKKTYEDVWLFMRWVEKINTMYVDPLPMYYYVQRSSSISNRKFSINKLNLIKSTKNNYKIIAKKYPEIKGLALKNIMLACIDIEEDLYYAARNNKRLAKYNMYLTRIIRNNIWWIIIQVTNIEIKDIIRIFLGMISIKAYVFIKEMKK